VEKKRKDAYGVALGRRGGTKRSAAPAAKVTSDGRGVGGRTTVRTRWDQAEFRHLVRTWKNERRATSSSVMIAMHPAYQRIIGFGSPAVPLILAELRRELDHWFWALKAITGEDPVPAERRGNMKEMAEIWLEWGRQRGYVR